jgi:hypothetical protein
VKRVCGGSLTVATGHKRTHENLNADDKSPLLSTTYVLAFVQLTFPTYLWPTYLWPTYLEAYELAFI